MLTLDECKELSYASFPTCLKTREDYSAIIDLLAYALNKSYDQLSILKYAYHPMLADLALLPRLADTLSFDYPIDYPYIQLRIMIKYLMKIKRRRGTLWAIKALTRLLNRSEEDILYMLIEEYSSIELLEYEEGVILIRYNFIEDYDFTKEALKMVIPAGYDYKLESLDDGDFRNREDYCSSDDAIKITDETGAVIYSRNYPLNLIPRNVGDDNADTATASGGIAIVDQNGSHVYVNGANPPDFAPTVDRKFKPEVSIGFDTISITDGSGTTIY